MNVVRINENSQETQGTESNTSSEEKQKITSPDFNKKKSIQQRRTTIILECGTPLYRSIKKKQSIISMHLHDFEDVAPDLLNKDQRTQKVQQVINKISNFNDNILLRKMIQQLDSKDEKCEFIDKVLARRDELQEIDQSNKIAEMGPLVSRFIKKLSGFRQLNVKPKINVIANDSKYKGSQTDRRQVQSQQQAFRVGTGSSVKSNTNIKSPTQESQRASTGTTQILIENQQQQNNQDLQTNAKKEEMIQPRLSSGKTNESSSLVSPGKDQTTELVQKNPNIRNVIWRMKMAGQGQTKVVKSYYNREIPKINFYSVSKNSKLMVQQGKQVEAQKVTKLLNKFQVKALASHFNSQLLNKNQYSRHNKMMSANIKDFDNGCGYLINTYDLIDRKIQITQPSSPKTSSILRYCKPVEAFETVQSDINQFCKKNNQYTEFALPKRMLKSNAVQNLENNIIKSKQQQQQLTETRSEYMFQNSNDLLSLNTLETDQEDITSSQQGLCFPNQAKYNFVKTVNRWQKKKPQIESRIQEKKQEIPTEDEFELESNNSFVSYTEVRLDQLYKEYKTIKEQADFFDQCYSGENIRRDKRHSMSNINSTKNKYQQELMNIQGLITDTLNRKLLNQGIVQKGKLQ